MIPCAEIPVIATIAAFILSLRRRPVTMILVWTMLMWFKS